MSGNIFIKIKDGAVDVKEAIFNKRRKLKEQSEYAKEHKKTRLKAEAEEAFLLLSNPKFPLTKKWIIETVERLDSELDMTLMCEYKDLDKDKILLKAVGLSAKKQVLKAILDRPEALIELTRTKIQDDEEE